MADKTFYAFLTSWLAPRMGRISRYTIGSIIAAVTSEIVFFLCFSVVGLGTTACSVIAFIAGAVPNWALNRRWAWKRSGQLNLMREVVVYTFVSAVTLVVSSEATAATNRLIAHMTTVDSLVRSVLVTLSYLASMVLLWGAKFLVYELFVFAEPRRSRHQVPSTTELKRHA